MSTVNEQLAALAAEVAGVKGAADDVTAAASSRIAAISNEYVGRIAGLNKSVYVNQITGSDVNPGTAALPFASLDAAISAVPLGGRVTIYLQADYTTSSFVSITQRFVAIRSDSTIRRAVSFGRVLNQAVQPNLRDVYGFFFYNNSSLNLSGLRINVPALDGVWPTYGEGRSNLFQWPSSSEFGATFVAIGYCDIDIPATPYGNLFAAGMPFGLWVGGNTLVGATASLNGRLLRGITATGGTTPPRDLYTNLTVI